jgi:hypothetical protein
MDTHEAAWSLDLALIKGNGGVVHDSEGNVISSKKTSSSSSGTKSPPPRKPKERTTLPRGTSLDSPRESQSKFFQDEEDDPSYSRTMGRRFLSSKPQSFGAAMLTSQHSGDSDDSSAAAQQQQQQSHPFPRPFSNGVPSVEVVDGLGKGGYAAVVLVQPKGTYNGRGGNQSSSSSPGGGLGGHGGSGGSFSVSMDDLYAMKVVSKEKQKRHKDQKRLAIELKVMRDLPPSRFLERCHAAFESATDVCFVCDYIGGEKGETKKGGGACSNPPRIMSCLVLTSCLDFGRVLSLPLHIVCSKCRH